MQPRLTTDHVRERFYKAVEALATMEGSLQNRVETAALILMPFGDHDAEGLPEEFRATFNHLRHLYMTDVTNRRCQNYQQEEIFSFYIKLRGGI